MDDLSVSTILIEVTAIVVLVFLNGFLAMAEIAIVSSRKVRLEHLGNRGNTRARIALHLANSPETFLSTVQVGITLVGVLAGAFGGATLAKVLATWIKQSVWLNPYAEAIGIAIVVISITYLSLIIGELVPKRLALNNPERIACSVARTIKLLSVIAAPVVKLLSSSTTFVFRLLGKAPVREQKVTAEEIRILLDQGTRTGSFEAAESQLVLRVLRFGDKRASGIMTPRRSFLWLDVDDSMSTVEKKTKEKMHSIYPVFEGTQENIIGCVRATDMLSQTLSASAFSLRPILRQPLFVVESMSALKLLEMLRTSHSQVAFVVDEYGDVQGLVTLDDILEAIVGDIPSSDAKAHVLMPSDDGSWLLDGMMAFDEFAALMNIDDLDDEERNRYQTTAGIVLSLAGAIPRVGQSYTWRGFQIEVVKMDGVRIDKIRVRRPNIGSGTTT